MVSWQQVKGILIFVGPMLLPKAISYYKSFREGASGKHRPIRPMPWRVTRAVGLLIIVSVLALIASLPYFGEENIFTMTQSRVQIPVDVLFTRLSTLRPNAQLTEFDNALRQKMVSLESKLLYLKFGPDAMANCLFCAPDDHKSYIYYSLPAILTPHLFNAAVLALATSGFVGGHECGIWRRTATLGAIALAGVDLWLVAQSDHQLNAKATRLEDLDMTFWKMRVFRMIMFAMFDGFIAWLMYLSSTHRAFVHMLTPGERMEQTYMVMEDARKRLLALGVLQNTVNRSEMLRSKHQEYWQMEGNLMAQVFEEKSVVEAVNNAIEHRLNMDKISEDADKYSDEVMREVVQDMKNRNQIGKKKK